MRRATWNALCNVTNHRCCIRGHHHRGQEIRRPPSSTSGIANDRQWTSFDAPSPRIINKDRVTQLPSKPVEPLPVVEVLGQADPSPAKPELWRDDSGIVFSCPMCASGRHSLDELAAHISVTHDDLKGSQASTAAAHPCTSYPFTEPAQRAPQQAYQRHNTMMTARVLRRHHQLSLAAATSRGPHVVMLLDIANMERSGIDTLITLAPLELSDRVVLSAVGLISSPPVTCPPPSGQLPPLDESMRRHILRVALGGHPITFVAMLEDSIVPNCKVMKAVSQLATLHPLSVVEILWAATGDEAGDYCLSAFIAELRRAEREIALVALGAKTDQVANVDACFVQRRAARSMAKTGAPELPTLPLMLLSDDQIQRAAMGQLFGVANLAYSHTYAVMDIVQCLRGLYWRAEDEGRRAGREANSWSEQPWLRRYLGLD